MSNIFDPTSLWFWVSLPFLGWITVPALLLNVVWGWLQGILTPQSTS